MADSSTQAGAARLCENIESYWRARGKKVHAFPVMEQIRCNSNKAVWSIQSTLKLMEREDGLWDAVA